MLQSLLQTRRKVFFQFCFIGNFPKFINPQPPRVACQSAQCYLMLREYKVGKMSSTELNWTTRLGFNIFTTNVQREAVFVEAYSLSSFLTGCFTSLRHTYYGGSLMYDYFKLLKWSLYSLVYRVIWSNINNTNTSTSSVLCGHVGC